MSVLIASVEHLPFVQNYANIDALGAAAGITGRHVLDVIRRMGEKAAIPFPDLFPGANPVALDLLSKLLTFDQYKRYTVEVRNV